MLVITRKTSEGITLSDNIEIKILEVSGDKVKIGISAPKEISIVRNELLEAKQANLEASQTISKSNLQQLLGILKKGEN